MLNKANRFHGRTALNAVYAKGQTVRQGNLALRYLLNNRRSNSRLAIVISKKTEKSAVKRNRIRRRIYAAMKPQLSQPKASFDLIITVYSSALGQASHQDLVNDLAKLLNKAGIL